MNAFEEIVIVGAASGGLLVGMVAQDLLAMGPLDLVFGRLIPELCEAEDSIVILALKFAREKKEKVHVSNRG